MLFRSTTCLLAFLARQAAGEISIPNPLKPVEKGKGGGLINPQPYIIEGTEADVGEYPYYVHMQIAKGGSLYSCGGSLIAPRVILSAAHCNDPYSDSNIVTGFVGATVFWSTDNGAVLGECEEWRNHPEFVTIEYDSDGYIQPGTSVLGGNDFALCLLKEPVDIDTSDVVLAMNDDPFFPPEDSEVESMGMGRTSGDRVGRTDVLLRADLSIYPQDACLGNSNDVDDEAADTMICTFDIDDSPMSGVCSGDSGGPIVTSSVVDGKKRHTQVGVVSWGSGNCGTNPDVYARLSAGLPWIRETVCDDWGLRESEFCEPPKCPNGLSLFTVEVNTDGNPEQNKWTLKTPDLATVAEEEFELPFTSYFTKLCLAPGEYNWEMTDTANDGMPDGSFIVSLNNQVELDSELAGGFTGSLIGANIIAPDDLTFNPTAAPTPQRSESPTMAPTEFECITDQVLQVTVETDNYQTENNWILELYDDSTSSWMTVASDPLLYGNTLSEQEICLDEASVYRFSIFDSYGDGLCYQSNCGYFEVRLNGSIIAAGDSFGSEDVTVFNTCVNDPGEFTVPFSTSEITADCDQLDNYLASRSTRVGIRACRVQVVGSTDRVRDICSSSCSEYGEGDCALPS